MNGDLPKKNTQINFLCTYPLHLPEAIYMPRKHFIGNLVILYMILVRHLFILQRNIRSHALSHVIMKRTPLLYTFFIIAFFIFCSSACMHVCVNGKNKTYKKPKNFNKKKYTCILCCLLHCFYSYITLQTYFYLIFFIYTHTYTSTQFSDKNYINYLCAA